MFKLFRKSRTINPLDDVLFQWSRSDPYRTRDLLRSVGVFGATGSGKSSGSGDWFGNAIVAYPRSSGLILCAKPEDKPMWEKMFARHKREKDYSVFEPGGTCRFNFLDFVLQSGGDTRQVTKCITTIGETLRSDKSGGTENSRFFEREEERLLYNAVGIVKLATGKVTAPDLQKFITTAPLSAVQIATPQYQASFHFQSMLKAEKTPKSPVEQHDYEQATDYWMSEFPNQADKMRSCTTAGVLGVLHVFNTGEVRELVSTTTNVTPNDMHERGHWVLDLPERF